MKYIDAEKLKAEIDKRYAEYRAKMKTDDFTYYEGMADALDLFEQFLDSLPEQPVLPGIDEEGIPGRDFIPVAWVDACERYGKWKIVRAEQPEELEEEIGRYIPTSLSVKFPTLNIEAIKSDIRCIARHFAEWQKVQDQKTIELAEDHAMLAGMNKMEQQMKEKGYEAFISMFFTDRTIPVLPMKDVSDLGLNYGDKVRVIVIKEN